MRILSFGGGVQTTALAVLWVRAVVAADHCVFADTGGETPETYAHLDAVDRFLQSHGRRLERVRWSGPSLEEFTLTRRTSIPVHWSTGGMLTRDCTRQWKIRPVNKFARSTGATSWSVLLGISVDEVHRMKPSPEAHITREYPLIDLRLDRQQCVELNTSAGFVDVPRSACFYCPFHPARYYRDLNRRHPELFKRAEQLEVAVNERLEAKGRRAYILGRAPLRESAQLDQATLPGFGEECEGVCGV